MTIERHTRRAETAKELDRETWAELDLVGFQFVVTGDGEAVAGPFYFGRAFDAPPIFSYSAVLRGGSSEAAPQITIGVSEWIIDEQDMYVGCWLWLTFVNCFAPGPSHGVVLSDDFEKLLAVQGGGPEGDEIPYVAFSWFSGLKTAQSYSQLFWPSNYVWPSDHPSGFPVVASRELGGKLSPYRWVQMWGGLENSFQNEPIQRWRVSNSVFRSGTFSLYCDELVRPDPVVPLAASGSAILVPANILGCHTYGSDYREHLWGWRSEPGASVKISGYRRHSWVDATTGGDAVLRAFVVFYGVDGIVGIRAKDFVLNEPGLEANEWRYFEFSEDQVGGSGAQGAPLLAAPVAPAGTRYVRIEFDVSQFWLWRDDNSTPLPPFETWIEDVQIEIVGPQVPFRQPEFDVAIKFQGRILKNYVGVHPLRSYEGPSKVVLS